MDVDPSDPRWAFHNLFDDPLAKTDWYAALPPETRHRLGLHTAAHFAKIGIQFESILQRGLLEYAEGLENGAPEFRYLYHEVIEEGQHSLMFQELVNRVGVDVQGMPRWVLQAGRLVVQTARWFPELFFLFVLGGEEPIDHVQREALRHKEGMPPVLRRVAQIHVTEEARHISFARLYLRQRVAALPWRKRQLLAVATPVIFGVMAPLMLQPSSDAVREFGIPLDVWEACYGDNSEFSRRLTAATAKARALCEEMGLMTPAAAVLWKRFGMADASRPAA
jgi:hypothetical protein